MILHKADWNGAKTDRRQYLSPINNAYHEHFENLDEYKQKDNFKRVLNQLSLDDVKMAIQRSEQLMIRNQEKGFHRYQYKTYSYYAENPSLSIWESIKKIMTECGIL